MAQAPRQTTTNADLMAAINALSEKIDNQAEKIGRLNTDVAVMTETLKAKADTIDKLDKKVFGNGADGLDKKVDRIEIWVREFSDGWKKTKWAIWTPVISFLVMLAFLLVIAYGGNILY